MREDYANSLVFSGMTPVTLPRIQPKTDGEKRKQQDMCRRKRVEDLEESKNGRTVGRQEEMDKRISEENTGEGYEKNSLRGTIKRARGASV
jgi:hypothetical protein